MENLKKLIRREVKKILEGSSSGGSLGNLDSDREGIWYPPGQKIKLPKESLAGYIQVEDSPAAQDTLGSNKKDINYTITKKVDYNPVPETKPESENFVEDETGNNVVKSLEERKMKKSELKKLIRECILEVRQERLDEGILDNIKQGIQKLIMKTALKSALKDPAVKAATNDLVNKIDNLNKAYDDYEKKYGVKLDREPLVW